MCVSETRGRGRRDAASWASLVHRQRALDVGVEELVDELVLRVEELVRGPDSTILPFQSTAMKSAIRRAVPRSWLITM